MITTQERAFFKSLRMRPEESNWIAAEREEFLADVSAFYKDDVLEAGVNVAYLHSKKCYYASVCRYSDRMGKNKQVVAKAYGETFEEVFVNLRINWRNIIRQLAEQENGRLREQLINSINQLDAKNREIDEGGIS